MNIKTLSLTIAAGSLLATTAMADYTGLSYDIVEQVGDGAQAGTWTARIFADFNNSVDRLDAVFGNADNMLSIDSSGGFFQSAFGDAVSTGINPAFYPLAPDLVYDSWVTIGSENQIDNAMIDIGIDWTEFENGGNIETDNGIWFSIPNDMQGFAGDDLRVLIGQFTTFGWDSQIYGSINLQGRQGDFESFVARDQYFGWVPAPATMVLFSLVFLKSRRRH